MQLTATEGVKSQEYTTCERSLRKQAWFGLEKSGPRGTALLFYPVWSSDFQYHREDKSRLFTVIYSQLEKVAAWEMTDCHNERNIYSENGCTPEKDVQIGLESPFVEMLRAQQGKPLSNLLSFDTCSTRKHPEVPSNLNHYVILCFLWTDLPFH